MRGHGITRCTLEHLCVATGHQHKFHGIANKTGGAVHAHTSRHITRTTDTGHILT